MVGWWEGEEMQGSECWGGASPREEALLVQLCPAVWKKQQRTTFYNKKALQELKTRLYKVSERKGMCFDVCNFVVHQK